MGFEWRERQMTGVGERVGVISGFGGSEVLIAVDLELILEALV
jgi:hypothetical protein